MIWLDSGNVLVWYCYDVSMAVISLNWYAFVTSLVPCSTVLHRLLLCTYIPVILAVYTQDFQYTRTHLSELRHF